MERIGRYRIVGELGRGAMGVVYHATDPNIGRAVAIKTIRLNDVRNPQEQAKLRERLFREARSAGMLSHPGIVTIYDVEQQGDLAWIAMEFVDGPTLDELMSRETPIPKEQMFSILGQTAVALDYAHQKGIVHRDIKPANIMISADGTAKITDFGIAKITAAEQFTMTGSIVGTPHYMSPEQVQGKAVDGRSDQFSLAVLAYEMVTGEKPFTGEHLTAVVFKIVAEEPPQPHRVNPTLTPQIEAVLRRALAKKADQRYRNCVEFVDALEGACSASPGWLTMVRGGSLQAPTVADAPKPPVSLPPGQRTRRAASSSTTTDSVPKRSGFLPFLAAILVAAGLLALIGWQAAPWLAQRSTPPARTEPAPEVKVAETPNPAPRQPGSPEDQRPSPLSSPETAPASAADAQPSPQPPPEAAPPEKAPPEKAEDKPAEKPTEKPAEEPPRRSPPVRTAAAAPRTTPVSIVSSPAGATAVIDGRPETACTTPCSIAAPPGRHSVSLSLAGHMPERREIVVTANPQELPMIMLRAPGGTLMVSSIPAGAAITINGKVWNQVTPAQVTLTPGNYTVTVEKDGRRSTRNIEVRNGAINYIKVTLD